MIDDFIIEVHISAKRRQNDEIYFHDKRHLRCRFMSFFIQKEKFYLYLVRKHYDKRIYKYKMITYKMLLYNLKNPLFEDVNLKFQEGGCYGYC